MPSSLSLVLFLGVFAPWREFLNTHDARSGRAILLSIVVFSAFAWWTTPTSAQSLNDQLLQEDAAVLAQAAREQGDAKRGAVTFFQAYLACSKCHTHGQNGEELGPDLTRIGEQVSDVELVESVLRPSKVIKKGFEPVSVVTTDGKTINGLLVADEQTRLTLRDAAQDFRLRAIDKEEIEDYRVGGTSIMPEGQVNVLASRQQFYDLIRYLIEIRDGGAARAAELQPPPALLAARPLPEYENRIDHAGMIGALDEEAFRRGEAIYNRLCINCHGDLERPGSLPTSLRFASGKFKNGADPHSMYQTLTRGFGMMAPQTWMVPEQKYDVIHYIRQAYLRPHNPQQLVAISPQYLAGLPKGDTRGPKPPSITPWEQMDYGPNLVATYEIGADGSNFAYKGNAVRLDGGPGGVSRGRHWLIFDYDTLRVAAAYSGEEFIDYNGINFNDRHGVHPRIGGVVQFANPTGPGWANPETGTFADDERVVGRDGRRYGPLPRRWAHLRGMYSHGADTIFSYTVGDTEVLEMPRLQTVAAGPIYERIFSIGPRKKPMVLQVAHRDVEPELLTVQGGDGAASYVTFGSLRDKQESRVAEDAPLTFDGATQVEIAEADAFEMRQRDFTIAARIKTTAGGSIFCKTAPQAEWAPDGSTFFVRGGRLCFDIGWVGVVQSRRRVDDGQPHHVAAVYQAETGMLQLFVDGKPDEQKRLRPRQATEGFVARIGFTADNFPQPRSYFEGELSHVRFYQRALGAEELQAAATGGEVAKSKLIGDWRIDAARDNTVADVSGNEHHGVIKVGPQGTATSGSDLLVAGLSGQTDGLEWLASEQGDLRLRIPAGSEPLRLTVWLGAVDEVDGAEQIAASVSTRDDSLDLSALTNGGPPRWPQEIKTTAQLGNSDGPFAVDVLAHPVENPWFCRMRLTGFDFFEDGDSAAVCTWDGSVWRVSGLSNLEAAAQAGQKQAELTWRRIASGLFQPLGLKIVDGEIFVTCRDQLCKLHDINGDGEVDFYENFNNDHQVTEHFHEFAMGLQVDEAGNFYYAKSARHALPAVVPHHGTLLRVSADGSQTEILAVGFRAANGVCLNDDGTFIVTDQEGHWNPKNRINWVSPGGFYGNMYGYHDVTDSSDDAMQPPLCWITNEFDRSPAELLWVDSQAWGPLNGSLLNLSYGYGQVYVVPHEEVGGQKQGGMCALPIERLPTGVMRGRFHPRDGQLYLCGMFAWAGNQEQPGGFYRLRYTGKPVHLPISLAAKRRGLEIKFSGPLDPQSAADMANYVVKVWSLRRTANYGSKHYDERPLTVSAAHLSDDGKTVLLDIPEIQPTWSMEVKYSLRGAGGEPVEGVIHNTIHQLGE